MPEKVTASEQLPVPNGINKNNASPIFCGEGRLKALLCAEFERFGYSRYKMRKFEPYALYAENLPFLKDEHILTFSDPDGALMALKPDITLSIAKNARCGDKLYYTESVYRPSREMRSFSEIAQMGLEYIGRVDDCATVEIAHLALAALRATGENFALDIGHMGFLSALMDETRLLPPARETLSRLLGGKNTHEIRALCAREGVPDDLTDAFARLSTLRGGLSRTLPEAETLVRNAAMRAAMDELRALSGALSALGEDDSVSLDFSIISDFSYYNGLVLRGYVEGVPRAVLSGGRYDPLLARLGRKGEAMGFALYLDELTRAFSLPAPYDADALCLYRAGESPAALMDALSPLRASGSTVRAAIAIPEGFRYKTLYRFENGALKEAKPC